MIYPRIHLPQRPESSSPWAKAPSPLNNIWKVRPTSGSFGSGFPHYGLTAPLPTSSVHPGFLQTID